MSKIEDRELLELAAKAGGVKFPRWLVCQLYGPTISTCDSVDADGERINEESWSPLTDDGDALRLAVKLELDLAIGPGAAMAGYRTDDGWGPCEPYGNDACAATRRAIVRAAAEIGRAI